MVVYSLTDFGGKAHAGFCRKKLGSNTDDKACSSHQYQNKKLLNDIAVVIICNSHIDDLGDDDRYQQVKYNFQKLEKRSQNAFFFVISKIFCECSHFFFFLRFLIFL